MKRDDASGDLFASPLDPRRARAARDQGMQRVAARADRASHAWNALAFMALEKHARTHAQFMTEDVRVASAIPDPPDRRAWGPVAHRAVVAGIVAVIEYKRQRSVTCHGSPKPLYRSLVFRGGAA
jgi:hypothetical protein